MHIIRTIFWVVIAVVLVIFAMNNWEPVTIKVWPGWRVLDTKLPALVIGAFLLGLLPMYVMFRASRWSLRRRLESSERSLADLRAMANRTVAAPIPGPTPSPVPTPMPDTVPSSPPEIVPANEPEGVPMPGPDTIPAPAPSIDPPQPPQAAYARAGASKG